MKHSLIISQMTWSYSRLTTFEKCKYSFLLKYIEEIEEEPTYFAGYGKLIHELLEQYHTGKITQNQAAINYLIGYSNLPKDISSNVYIKYYDEGKAYIDNLIPTENILSAEQQVNFDISGNQYVGFIDRIDKTESGYNIVDYKTRILKSKSSSKSTKRITKDDILFMQYARQLYMYSIATEQIFGKPPDNICFHCFRDNSWATEKYNAEKRDEVIDWSNKLIEKITYNDDWSPTLDWFSCKYLCGYFHICEYAQANYK